MELLTHFPVAMLAMLLGYIFFMPRGGKLPEKATFFLMFVSILFAAQFRSKRFAEYFPPFAVLFLAFSFQAFRRSQTVELPEDFKRDIEPYLDVDKPKAGIDTWGILREASAWTIGIVLGIYFLFNMIGFHKFGIEQEGLAETIRGNEANDRYRRTMEWANANIPAGERIFNANWDDFPKLFFYDQKHQYVYGLDPNYLYSQNPDLYKLLLDITAGKTEDAGPVIREKFGANYVFTDEKENDEMVAKLLASGWTDLVYDDDEGRILKIRTEKGDPWKDPDEAPETPEEKEELDRMEQNDNLNVNSSLPDENVEP
jgi:hypothetical protein